MQMISSILVFPQTLIVSFTINLPDVGLCLNTVCYITVNNADDDLKSEVQIHIVVACHGTL